MWHTQDPATGNRQSWGLNSAACPKSVHWLAGHASLTPPPSSFTQGPEDLTRGILLSWSSPSWSRSFFFFSSLGDLFLKDYCSLGQNVNIERGGEQQPSLPSSGVRMTCGDWVWNSLLWLQVGTIRQNKYFKEFIAVIPGLLGFCFFARVCHLPGSTGPEQRKGKWRLTPIAVHLFFHNCVHFNLSVSKQQGVMSWWRSHKYMWTVCSALLSASVRRPKRVSAVVTSLMDRRW